MAKYQLKFRAWNGKKVVSWNYIRQTGNRFYLAMNQNGYVLMQFTGFKDAKGRDVYEGDLLAWPDWHEHRENDPMPVVFEYGGFWADGSGLWDYAVYIKKGSNKYADPTYKLEDLEVVGDIYRGDLR